MDANLERRFYSCRFVCIRGSQLIGCAAPNCAGARSSENADQKTACGALFERKSWNAKATSAIAEGNVFQRVREKLNLPSTPR